MRKGILQRFPLVLALLLIAVASPIPSGAQSLTFKIPPVKIPLNVKDQHVTISASALITLIAEDRGLNTLKLELKADLADLQQNMTSLLSSALDKDDHCGDSIAIQRATLIPLDPAGLVDVQLHYERWACAKIFGKQQSQKLISGNADMQIKLTPAIEDNGGELRLMAEVGQIEADGSLGELLRSGALGQILQDKVRAAILSAMQKGTDLSATLPPVIQGYATIQNAQFKNAGAGRLMVVLDGKLQITNDQLQTLAQQVKDRVELR